MAANQCPWWRTMTQRGWKRGNSLPSRHSAVQARWCWFLCGIRFFLYVVHITYIHKYLRLYTQYTISHICMYSSMHLSIHPSNHTYIYTWIYTFKIIKEYAHNNSCHFFLSGSWLFFQSDWPFLPLARPLGMIEVFFFWHSVQRNFYLHSPVVGRVEVFVVVGFSYNPAPPWAPTHALFWNKIRTNPRLQPGDIPTEVHSSKSFGWPRVSPGFQRLPPVRKMEHSPISFLYDVLPWCLKTCIFTVMAMTAFFQLPFHSYFSEAEDMQVFISCIFWIIQKNDFILPLCGLLFA